MPDRVHATVQWVESADLQPVIDRPPSEAEGTQLVSRHHAVLTSRKLGDRQVELAKLLFAPNVGVKSRLAAVA